MIEEADLLVDNASFVLTMDDEATLLEGASVAVNDGRVAAIAAGDEIRRARVGPDTTIIDATDRLLTPGLVDAHTHLESCFEKGLMGGVDVDTFVDRYYSFVFGSLDEQSYADAVAVNLLACLKSGTTTVSDCGTLPTLEAAALDAASDSGARVVLARSLMDTHEPGDALAARFRETTGQALDNAAAFVGGFGSDDSRVRPALSLATIAGCSPELCVGAAEIAAEAGVSLQAHVAWSEPSIELTRERFGDRDVDYLERLGVLSPRFAAAHAICLDQADVRLFKESGSSVVHCPASSLMFAQGALAPDSAIPELARAGVNLAIGSDELSTGTSHDLVRDMWVASTAHAEARRAVLPDRGLLTTAVDDVSPAVLEMATRNGAQALGLADEVGSIEVGKRADLVLWDLTSHQWLPTVRQTVVANLISNGTAGTVETVICDGEVVIEAGRSTRVDEDALRERVQTVAARLASSAPWLSSE